MQFETFAPLDRLGLVLHAFSIRTTDDTKAEDFQHRFVHSLGFTQFAAAEQTHGNGVAVVDASSRTVPASVFQKVDALVTRERNLPLVIRCADCAAVYIIDRKTPAIGLVHSGKMGTLGKIVPGTILQMQTQFGTDPSDCLAFISPSIGPCHYEMDIWGGIEQQLRDTGVEDVCNPRVCTACHLDRYFSYRAEKGRAAARVGRSRIEVAMSLLTPPRGFDPAIPEMMDRPGNDPKLLRADLCVLEKINRLLGGHRIPLMYLPDLLKDKPVTVLDLGTGAADIPRAITRWARANNFNVQITGVDSNPEILQIARENVAGWPEIRIEQADLRGLPYPTESFDIVLCSLTLHHFSEGDVVAILRRIHDIARGGYIINDLRRNRIAIWLSKIMAHTMITNPIARFDAPASCERAFTSAELRRMARQAGLNHFSVHRHRFFRMALVGRK